MLNDLSSVHEVAGSLFKENEVYKQYEIDNNLFVYKMVVFVYLIKES